MFWYILWGGRRVKGLCQVCGGSYTMMVALWIQSLWEMSLKVGKESGPAANMGHNNWLTTTKTNNWQVKWIHSLSLCNAAFSWKTLYFKILVNVTFTGVYPPNISLAPSNGSILLLQDSASCHSTKLLWTLNLHKSNSSDPNLNIHEGARIDHPRWTHQQDQRAHVHALMGQNWTVYKWWM